MNIESLVFLYVFFVWLFFAFLVFKFNIIQKEHANFQLFWAYREKLTIGYKYINKLFLIFIDQAMCL